MTSTTAVQINVQASQTTEITVKAGQSLEIGGNATVKSMELGANGALNVHLSNGGTLVVTNFADVAKMNPSPLLALPGGHAIVLSQFQPTAFQPVQQSAAQKNAEEIAIAKPKAHESVVVKLHKGQDYAFGFNMKDAASVKNNGGQLVITFKDGAHLIIPNYGSDHKHHGAHFAFKDGSILADVGSSHGKDINMADAAKQLAEIKPAAGDNGPASAGGHDFGSTFAPDSLNSVNAIGPIGETALNYGTFDRAPEAAIKTVGPITPSLEVSSVWVKEDHSVQLDIHAEPENAHQAIKLEVSGFLPGWTVDTTTSGGAYDNATHTWTITLPAGTGFHGGPTVSPPAQSDLDMLNLQTTETVTDTTTGQTAVGHGTFDVYTDAVVDPVTLGAPDQTVNEDTAVPLHIAVGASADQDGSEKLTHIVVSANGGFPAGTTFNHGTIQADGTLLLTSKADLTSLTLTPPSHYHGTINMTATVTEAEGVQPNDPNNAEIDFSDNSATTSTNFTVIITDTIGKPTLEATDVVVKEDHSIQLQVSAALNANHSTADQLTVTIEGFKDGWTFNNLAGGTYNAATHTWSITLAPGASFTGGPTITPPADSDIDLKGLTVTATASDGIVSSSSAATENVFVDAVIDGPSITASALPGTEGHPVALNIAVSAGGDTADHSETLSKVTISGVPADATLNHGTQTAPGVWSVDASDLPTLSLTPSAHFSGTINLHISVTDTEGAILNTTTAGNYENDTSDNAATATTDLTITIGNTIDTPTIAAHDVIVKEDHSVQLDVSAHLNNAGPADQLTVTISGFQDGWTFNNLAGGSYNSATHTWSITLPAGAALSGGPTVTPPADSDIDLKGLTITATASDGSVTSAPVTANENVFVDAVIDGPSLTAANATGTEGHPVALNIAVSAGGDTADHSETLSKVTISGVPADATLNHGTQTSPGVWSVDASDLPTLSLTPSAHFNGTINLHVSVTDTEGAVLNTTSTGNFENDTSDNTATVTADLTVTIGDTIDTPTLSATDVIVKEDHSVQLQVDAHLNNPGAGDHLTVTIAGFQPGWTFTNLAGGTYNAATHTWSITLANGADFHGGPTIQPPTDSDIDLKGLTVTATATDGSVSASATATENVFVDAVIDGPSITAANTSGTEGHPVALTIAVNAGGDTTDGSETLSKVTISGVPTDATLNHGTQTSPGVWSLTQAELSGLTLTPSAHYNGTINLHVSVTDTEGATLNTTSTGNFENDTSDNTATATADLTVTIGNTIDTPTVSAADVIVKEDHSVALQVSAHLNNPDAGDHLTVTISGFQPGWTVNTTTSGGTYNATTHTWTLDLPPGVTSFTGGPTVTPPTDSDIDLKGLTVTATASDGSVSASTSATENVFVDAVIDGPSITASNATGTEGHPVALTIAVNAGGDTADGSETLSKVTISGVPTDATLNHGTQTSPGVWSLTQAELSGLTLTPSAHYNGTINLHVAVTDTEGATLNTTGAGNFENDLSDNSATATANISVTIGDTIDTPTITAHDVWVKEDHSVQLDVSAHLNNPGAGDHLTITIAGFQNGWTFTNLAGGTYDAATHSWSITLANGAAFTGGPTIAPPANSDLDLTGLTVTATATDGSVSASATATENVFVDAVVDPIGLTASDTSGSDNAPIALTIAVTPSVDTDGSEKLTDITISGVPSGASLNAGTKDGAGVWHLTTADLAGLKLTSVHGFDGAINLHVTATEAEQAALNTSGTGNQENDLSDNIFTISKDITVTVHDDTPVIVKAPTDTVDETNLAAGNVTVSDTVVANFFGDAPGTVTASGASSFGATGSLAGGHLTSGGVAVTVTASGNTYTGMAGGKEVFDLVLHTDGTYTFTLKAPLDHANASDPNDSIALNFGVTATDADGDTATGTIHVNVLDDTNAAHNDVNTFDMSLGHADGNVVSGLNGGAGAADTLSQDAPNHVTQIQFGTTIVNVPTTGTATIDGTFGTLKIAADGTYTYTLHAGTTGSGGGATDTPHTFTGNSFPTDLAESHAIGAGDQAALGELHSNMTINANTQVTGTITFDGAGYTNSLGTYTIAADGTLQAAQMVAPSITGTGANFSVGANAGAQELGFFLVADGFTSNNSYTGLDFAHGNLKFVFDYGQADARSAKVTDNGGNVNLVFTDAGGHDHVLNGPVYFSSDRGGANSLNADGTVHTISGVGSDNHTLTIGFEDLPGGGDKDFNDTIFNVQLNDHTAAHDATDVFKYTLTDSDGDHSDATLTFNGLAPQLIVGENVNDSGTSSTPYHVGSGHGTITGGSASDILIGDTGGANSTSQVKNYNVELILDVSGSMGALSDHSSKYYQLVQAVNHLLSDLHNYGGGTVTVNITPFDTTAHTGGTFTVTGGGTGYADALNFLQHMGGGGSTNYESALQAADTWLATHGATSGTDTFTYFVSDGEPNHYVTDTNPAASGTENQSVAQIQGDLAHGGDNTNEIATTQHLSTEVIGVGINVGSKIANIDLIDSTGHATNVTDPTQLDNVLHGASPLNQVAGVGADHLVGGNGNDLMFGDAVNTDVLAHAQGLTTTAGAGWDVFSQLEAGHGTNTGWTRADTVNYILSHGTELAAESHGSSGAGRTGGNDTIEGGAGDDVIFGQEGNDWIDGGTGNNTLYGGSGGDTFHISHAPGQGVDTIKDFSAANGDVLDVKDILTGFDPLHSHIENFVSVTADGHGNTVVAVDPTGGSHFQAVAVLEGVSIDLAMLTAAHGITTA